MDIIKSNPTQYFTDSGRIGYWKTSLKEIWEAKPREKFIFGQGLGSFAEKRIVLSGGRILDNPHNDYLLLLHDGGFLPLILIIILLSKKLKKINKPFTYGLLAYIIIAFFSFPSCIAPLVLVGI